MTLPIGLLFHPTQPLGSAGCRAAPQLDVCSRLISSFKNPVVTLSVTQGFWIIVSLTLPVIEKLWGNMWMNMLVTQSCPTLSKSMNFGPQAFLSMEFSRQTYWSGLLFPSPEGLPELEIEPESPTLQAGRFFTIWATREMPPLQTEYMKRQMYTVKQNKNIFRTASQMGLLWWLRE